MGRVWGRRRAHGAGQHPRFSPYGYERHGGSDRRETGRAQPESHARV